ncbi:unnamed protein product, partial [Allacma fusca]
YFILSIEALVALLTIAFIIKYRNQRSLEVTVENQENGKPA